MQKVWAADKGPLVEVYQGNCGEQAGALVQRGYSLFWKRCEGLKGCRIVFAWPCN
jgi:hypothetical protein